MWCPTAGFEQENTVILKEGVVPKGGYSISDNFVIPEAKYGMHYVRFWRYNRDDAVSFQFSVKPKVEVIPAQATPGATVKIKGTGFPEDSGGTAAITFDGKAITVNTVTSKTGTFISDFVVPNTMAGEHKFTASSPKILAEIVSANLKVVPAITLEPRQPEVGAESKITGYGFAAKSVIKVKYDNVNIASSPTTDENGAFSYTFKVPESSAKDHIITAEDGAGNNVILNLRLEGKAPPKPATLSPKAERFGWLGEQVVTFTWSPVADISGVTYTVEVAEDLNFFPLKPGMRKVGLTQANCTLTIKEGTYYWRVRGVDGVGNEGEWAISPYAFNVGFFSTWMLVIAGLICLFLFVLLLRSFLQRLREYE